MENTIAVIDYGLGNPGSILNMLKKIGANAKLTMVPSDLEAALAVILPGVGTFDQGMRNLHDRNLVPVLTRCVRNKDKPFLGICLGMQLLTNGSDEGTMPGLGWIDGYTRKFLFPDGRTDLRLPHMGWNDIHVEDHRCGSTCFGDRIFSCSEPSPRFYFVHNFHVRCSDEANVLATADYGYRFAAAIGKGKIVGTQFHPEKSHRFGLEFLRRFVDASRCQTT